MTRTVLRRRRRAITFDVKHLDQGNERVFTVSIGTFDRDDGPSFNDDEGKPIGFGGGGLAEVFISGVKAGSSLQHAVNDAAVLLSLALQHGASLDTVSKALSRSHDGGPGSIIGSVVEAARAHLAELAAA